VPTTTTTKKKEEYMKKKNLKQRTKALRKTHEKQPDTPHYHLRIIGTRLDGSVEKFHQPLVEFHDDGGYSSGVGGDKRIIQTMPCLSLLLLAGVVAFIDPKRGFKFLEPPENWYEVAFVRVPEAVEIYGHIIAETFTKVEVQLVDWWKDKLLKKIELIPKKAK
jgi:hypothetical protein